VNCNPGGLIAMKEMALGRVIRRWVTALEVLVDVDGHVFPRERVIAYAFRHSYAQRHADNGTPVDVLAELMGHANTNTTQGLLHRSRRPQTQSRRSARQGQGSPRRQSVGQRSTVARGGAELDRPRLKRSVLLWIRRKPRACRRTTQQVSTEQQCGKDPDELEAGPT
jgi:hypothetical protein